MARRRWLAWWWWLARQWLASWRLGLARWWLGLLLAWWRLHRGGAARLLSAPSLLSASSHVLRAILWVCVARLLRAVGPHSLVVVMRMPPRAFHVEREVGGRRLDTHGENAALTAAAWNVASRGAELSPPSADEAVGPVSS